MKGKRLVLSRETLATLNAGELEDIHGGTGWLVRSAVKGARSAWEASKAGVAATRAASEAVCSAIGRSAARIAESVATGVSGNYLYDRMKNGGGGGGNNGGGNNNGGH